MSLSPHAIYPLHNIHCNVIFTLRPRVLYALATQIHFHCRSFWWWWRCSTIIDAAYIILVHKERKKSTSNKSNHLIITPTHVCLCLDGAMAMSLEWPFCISLLPSYLPRFVFNSWSTSHMWAHTHRARWKHSSALKRIPYNAINGFYAEDLCSF